ncbi:MAG TPA: type II CAAX endopeptidase family protein [Longimicrobiales bacterium]
MTGTWYGNLLLGTPLAVVWLLAGFPMLFMPPAVGAPWVLAVTALFLWLHVWRPRRRGGRHTLATFRVRPIARPQRLLTTALPSVVLAGAGVSWLVALWAGPDAFQSREWDPIAEYAATPLGWVGVALLVAVQGPIIEEFYFRGLIQRSLERRFGAAVAIPAAAALFAILHFHDWPWTLQPFALGMLWGYAARVARTVWASTVMHATWNGLSLALGSLPSTRSVEPWVDSPAVAALMTALTIGGVLGLRAWRRGVEAERDDRNSAPP